MSTDWDDRLRHALKRVDPPADFASRVMSRLPAEDSRKTIRSRFAMAAAVALVLLSIGQVQWSRSRQEQRRRKAIFALELTAGKLQAVQERLARSAMTITIPKE